MKVLTVGTFDTPHAGHVRFLSECRKLANLVPQYAFYGIKGPPTKLIVGVNTDEFVKHFKGQYPLYPYEQRAGVIAGISGVTEVIPNDDGEDLKPMLLNIKPDILVVGSDWAKKDYYTQIKASQQWLDDNQISLLYIPYTEGISSTQLRERIRNL